MTRDETFRVTLLKGLRLKVSRYENHLLKFISRDTLQHVQASTKLVAQYTMLQQK